MYPTVIVFILGCILHNVELIETEEHYTNTWAVEIPGGFDVAKRVAEEHGYEIVRQVCFFLSPMHMCILCYRVSQICFSCLFNALYTDRSLEFEMIIVCLYKASIAIW